MYHIPSIPEVRFNASYNLLNSSTQTHLSLNSVFEYASNIFTLQNEIIEACLFWMKTRVLTEFSLAALSISTQQFPRAS